METFTAKSVVLVSFPFSDLSDTKLRPAIILAYAGKEDWILCQVTSKPYGDQQVIKITDDDFEVGSLQLISYARINKLFTANRSIIFSQVGSLKRDPFNTIIDDVIKIFQSNKQR